MDTSSTDGLKIMSVPIEDRIGIQELTHYYCLYIDTRCLDAAVDLFTDDGVFDETQLGLPHARGRSAVRAAMTGGLQGVAKTVHYVTNHLITEYAQAAASGLCYFLLEALFENGDTARLCGYYDDRYANLNGRWLFNSRRVALLMPPVGLPTRDGSRS